MTFEELMDCYHFSEYDQNRKAYEQLKEQMLRKNVTPVIGAGLSMWAYSSWKGLLEKYAESCGIKNEVTQRLEANQYDEAAELLEKETSQMDLNRYLEDSFSPQLMEQNLSKRLPYNLLIPKLFTGPILTTNFDRAIERLFADTNVPCPDTVTPSDIFTDNKLKQAQHSGDPILIKMHGDIGDPTNMVLTKAGYDRFYGTDPKKPDLALPLPKFLKNALDKHPLLFLGCSLEADRTCAVIRDCKNAGTHYALLPLPEETDNEEDPLHPNLRDKGRMLPALRERIKFLKDEMRILPIWYPYGMHDEALTAFFERLAEDCGINPAPAVKTDSQYNTLHKLVGRDDTVGQIMSLLSGAEPGCAWVEGGGGIGKTEICRAVHNRLVIAHPGWTMPFVDLTGVNSIPAFYDRVSRATKISLSADVAEPGRFLLAELLRKYPRRDGSIPPALYFDNWEDVQSNLKTDVKQVAVWLNLLRYNGFSLLFSSQVAPPDSLLPRPKRFRVTPLDENVTDHETMPEAEFLELDSVKLFLQVCPDVPPSEMPHLRKLIRQLEGHPLAIVLTATQAEKKTLGLKKLLGRWDATQDSINKRHSSLDVALGMAWDAVRETKDAVLYWILQYYSVGPIPKDFHDWLFRDGMSDEGMDALNANNLLRVNRENGAVGMLLPLKMQLPKLLPEGDDRWQAGLFRWAEALKALLDRANENNNDEEHLAAHHLALKLMPQVCHILERLMEKPGGEAHARLFRLMDSARNHFQYYVPSVTTLEKLTGHFSAEESPRPLASAYRYYGDLLYQQGNFTEARAAYDEAEPLFRRLKSDLGLANTLQSKGNLLRVQGDYAGAREAYDAAEPLYRDQDDDLGLAYTLKSKGDLLRLQGDYAGARAAYEEAEYPYRRLKDDLGLANTLRSKGALLYMQGDDAGARAAYDEAEPLYRRLKSDLGLANTLQSKGDLLRAQRKYADALDVYLAADALYEKLPEPMGLAYTRAEEYRCLKELFRDEEAEEIKAWLRKQFPTLPPPAQKYIKDIID